MTIDSKKTREHLEREGWAFRSFHDEPRLSELKELYEELGFEVKLLPLSDEDCGDCTECFDKNRERFKSIFTRPVR